MTKRNAPIPPLQSTMVPVTTMEELPVLSKDERDELLTSLEKAEAEIQAGRCASLAPGDFAAWLRGRGQAIRAKRRDAI